MDQLSSRSQRRDARHLVIPQVRERVLGSRDALSHGTIVAKTHRTASHCRRFRIILSPCNFVANDSSATSPFGFRASEQFAAREMAKTGVSFASVSSRILADPPVRSLARSFVRRIAAACFRCRCTASGFTAQPFVTAHDRP